jgi:acetyltransferase-like isoleucine patch superfamily enzyme
VISVAPGNVLEFVDDFLDEMLPKFPTKIIITGENNHVKISLSSSMLHPHLEVGGENNVLSIGKQFKPIASEACWYWFGKRNTFIVGDYVTLLNSPRIHPNFHRISMGGDDCSITIGNHCFLTLNMLSNGHKTCKDFHFRCGSGVTLSGLIVSPASPCSISVGNDTGISWNCLIGCGGHGIIDAEGNCTNVCQGVEIGDHVWIGTGVVIPGTAKIPKGCVVGSNAVVTKLFEEENCVLGGVPAKVIKKDVKWVWESPIMLQRGISYPKP